MDYGKQLLRAKDLFDISKQANEKPFVLPTVTSHTKIAIIPSGKTILIVELFWFPYKVNTALDTKDLHLQNILYRHADSIPASLDCCLSITLIEKTSKRKKYSFKVPILSLDHINSLLDGRENSYRWFGGSKYNDDRKGIVRRSEMQLSWAYESGSKVWSIQIGKYQIKSRHSASGDSASHKCLEGTSIRLSDKDFTKLLQKINRILILWFQGNIQMLPYNNN